MVLDGLDYGAAMWNPEGDMGDLEMWEIIEPFLYLGQRVKASTAGMGSHRGGSGYESLRLAWKTPFYEMQNIDHSAASLPFRALGRLSGLGRLPAQRARHEHASS